jgi:DNA-directed RNA polymerase delta subunit
MLLISPAKLAYILLRARELESDVPHGHHYRELAEFITDLNIDEQASLTALVWIGRETFDADELEEAIQTAREEATAPSAGYLLGMPQLAQFIEDGMEALGLSIEDAEDEVLRPT